MKYYSSCFSIFLLVTVLATYTESMYAKKDVFTDRDIELMQKNSDLAFIVLTDDVRQAILEVAQLDRDMQVNSACLDASRLIEQGLTTIPYELALDIVAEIEMKQADESANGRGCKTKCYRNLCVKNLLGAKKLRVCEGGIISGGLVVNADCASNCCCTRSRACTSIPCTTGPCVTGCGLVVNGESSFNGYVMVNCGEDVTGGLTVDDVTITGTLIVDGCPFNPCNFTGGGSQNCIYNLQRDTSVCVTNDPTDTVVMTVFNVLDATEAVKWTLFPWGGIAHGDGNTASGTNSVASGSSTQATASTAHAEGYQTIASGVGSHAEGYAVFGGTIQATEQGSHAEGCALPGAIIQATAPGAHAEGYTKLGDVAGIIQATGRGAHAEGYSYAGAITASGYGSHAEGQGTTATGSAAHAEGHIATASGYAAHAEGDETIASGRASHAEGYHTMASGYGAHAEGGNTTASGTNSHAAGQNAIAAFNNNYCWSDGTGISTSAVNQFLVQATGITGGVLGSGIIFNNGSAGVAEVTSATSAIGNNATWSFVATTPADWAGGVPPTTLADAINRIVTAIQPTKP